VLSTRWQHDHAHQCLERIKPAYGFCSGNKTDIEVSAFVKSEIRQSRYEDVNGICLLAPGHFTAWPGFHRRFVDDLEKAQSMINEGKGNEKSTFSDGNSGKQDTRVVKASVYQSWFSDTGPAEFVTNMRSMKGGIPVLYIAGSKDRIPQTKNREYAFDVVPTNPNSKFVIIESNHLDVPRKADEVVIEWLRNL
jgi:hypothetical protein